MSAVRFHVVRVKNIAIDILMLFACSQVTLEWQIKHYTIGEPKSLLYLDFIMRTKYRM